MRAMNDQAIARLEAKLEHLIEGAFAQLFSKTIRAQDIALHLARAMEDGIQPGNDGDPRPYAPDHYIIRVNPDVYDHLIARQPLLAQLLAQHLVELAATVGYRLSDMPKIDLIAATQVEPNELVVDARHHNDAVPSTAVMKRIEIPETTAPQNPQLIINGKITILLKDPVVNIGRSRDNEIVLNDPYASRHHAQLRLRFGVYTLFDTQSQGGILVNDVVVREHRLQPGDVIKLGKTQMVYLEDQTHWQTESGVPIDL
jgi:FhaA, N-terminal domain/FHA domain